MHGTRRIGLLAIMWEKRMRIVLGVALLVVSGFAVWSWVRPYDWRPDAAARCTVEGVEVRRDHANLWVNVHLRMRTGHEHDLTKPVCLEVMGGAEKIFEPADTTLGGDKDRGTTDLWFKFWIDEEDVAHPLCLHVNDGSLILKSNRGIPDLGPSGVRYFVTHSW